MKQKKILIIVFIVLFIFMVLTAIGVYAFGKINKELEQLSTIEVSQIDLTNIEDGEYFGSYQTSIIQVKVKVMIMNHHIESITILEHNHGQGEAAEQIIDVVIDQQSLDVDLIASATYSSKVILLAIDDALD